MLLASVVSQVAGSQSNQREEREQLKDREGVGMRDK